MSATTVLTSITFWAASFAASLQNIKGTLVLLYLWDLFTQTPHPFELGWHYLVGWWHQLVLNWRDIHFTYVSNSFQNIYTLPLYLCAFKVHSFWNIFTIIAFYFEELQPAEGKLYHSTYTYMPLELRFISEYIQNYCLLI